MSNPSSTDLREELNALAETQTFSPDPSVWDRGRRARRTARVVRGAAALAVVAIVVGVGAIAVRPDQQAPQPAGEVRGGALPSRVDLDGEDLTLESPDDPLPFEDSFAIGRASVALGGNSLALIGAEDGKHHHYATIPAPAFALSPDGYRLAFWADDGALDLDGTKRIDPNRIYLADLRTGDVTAWAHNFGRGAEVTSFTWQPDSTQVRWIGQDEEGAKVAAAIDVTGPSEEYVFLGRYGARGVPSPSGDIVALASGDKVAFEEIPPRGQRTGVPVDRPLPADLYPQGADVTPVGWADEDTLVAIIDPPQSDVVERPRLALITSPDVPESEWIFREFLPRLPPEATSFAVDLIPDLTGDPDQELTHDFADEEAPESDSGSGDRLRQVAGGLMVLLAGLAFVRMMHKRA